MPNDPQATEAFLKTLLTSDRERAAAFDAVHNVKDDAQAQRVLEQLHFSQDIKAQLWDARHGMPLIERPQDVTARPEDFTEGTPRPTAGPPTQATREAQLSAMGISPLAIGGQDPRIEALKGAGKAALEHVSNLGTVARNYIPGVSALDRLMTPIPVNTQASNHAQQFGKTAESVAEFAVPMGGEGLLGGIAQGMGAKGAGQLSARMLGGGAEMAAKTVGQGGTSGEVKTNAVIGAASPAVSAGLTGIRNAITERLPEKLYGQIFKADPADIKAKYTSIAAGEPVNPTLAKEAMERGISGTSEKMAVKSITDLNALESELQSAAAGKVITLPQKGAYVSMLKEVKGQYAKTIFSDRADEADQLIKALQSHRGEIADATDALKVKRFLDAMRNTSSFRDNPMLSPRQEEFKIAADKVRAVLHGDPTLSTLLNEERIRIQAIDDIVKDAVGRSNKRLLGLTDVLLGGGGLASGATGGGIGMAAAARGFQQPFTLTNTAQGLRTAGKAVPKGAETVAVRGAAALAAAKKKDEP
jgi:hypothetical protein